MTFNEIVSGQRYIKKKMKQGGLKGERCQGSISKKGMVVLRASWRGQKKNYFGHRRAKGTIKQDWVLPLHRQSTKARRGPRSDKRLSWGQGGEKKWKRGIKGGTLLPSLRGLKYMSPKDYGEKERDFNFLKRKGKGSTKRR